jgi:hypothetical protein
VLTKHSVQFQALQFQCITKQQPACISWPPRERTQLQRHTRFFVEAKRYPVYRKTAALKGLTMARFTIIDRLTPLKSGKIRWCSNSCIWGNSAHCMKLRIIFSLFCYTIAKSCPCFCRLASEVNKGRIWCKNYYTCVLHIVRNREGSSGGLFSGMPAIMASVTGSPMPHKETHSSCCLSKTWPFNRVDHLSQMYLGWLRLTTCPTVQKISSEYSFKCNKYTSFESSFEA